MKNNENDKTKKEKTTKDKKRGAIQDGPKKKVPFCIAKSILNTSKIISVPMSTKKSPFGHQKKTIMVEKRQDKYEQRWTKLDMIKMYKTMLINEWNSKITKTNTVKVIDEEEGE